MITAGAVSIASSSACRVTHMVSGGQAVKYCSGTEPIGSMCTVRRVQGQIVGRPWSTVAGVTLLQLFITPTQDSVVPCQCGAAEVWLLSQMGTGLKMSKKHVSPPTDIGTFISSSALVS